MYRFDHCSSICRPTSIDAEVKKALDEPAIRERFAKQDFRTAWTPPEKFAAFLQAEVNKWMIVVKSAGLAAK